MPKILDVYEQYKIMAELRLHQFRVAAVAKQILDGLAIELDKHAVISACLLHDMANIVKFDLTEFPEFLQPEGVEYWQKVQQEYFDKYKTKDEHPATLAIAKELNMPSEVQELVASVGFVKGRANANSSDYGRKICSYADMRVGPHGVISLEERLRESAQRYSGESLKLGERNDDFALALRQIEKQIFSHCKIKPEDITDRSVAPIIEQLKAYEI